MSDNFTFHEHEDTAQILHKGFPIITFIKNFALFGGKLSVQNQVMKPGGRAEVAFMPLFATHGYAHAVTEVNYQYSICDNGLILEITPSATKNGTKNFDLVKEVCTLSVKLEDNRFIWTQHLSVTFLKDLNIAECNSKTPVRVYCFPKTNGKQGKFLQFADPMPVNASGPAVPMTRDWLNIPEPSVGPDSFQKHWKRDYTKIIYQNTDNSYAWTELNKTKIFGMLRDNQCARECHAKGKLYLVKDDNEALEYSFNVPSHFHHICEWGLDFHCWLDAEEFAEEGIIKEGTIIEAETSVKMVDKNVVEAVLDSAEHIVLTERELFFSNLPAYEEPENSFTVSALELDDASPWRPSSEGCSWQKSGGYKENSGSLVISNKFSMIGTWEQNLFGPSHWGNPFIPGTRYRLSAWVRCENLEMGFTGGPMIGVVFKNYLDIACKKEYELVDQGWSKPLDALNYRFSKEINWTYIELLTAPCPNYVLNGTIMLKFEGLGDAYFSNVRWEVADDTVA